MGDIFDDCGNHVVLLYYFNPDSTPANRPIYYEEVPPRARRNETGGWGYIAGYAPYRYNEIRDDLYLPWLSHAWYGWESILFARNNNDTPVDYVFQHTIYTAGGDDAGAINNKTYRRTKADDLWELPTANLQPGNFYRGGGVVAADTGDSAVVYIKGNSQAMAYSGVYPFDSLGQASASTLYMPAFLYTQGGNGYRSKIFVQNAGKTATDVTATYYGDDGSPPCSHTIRNLAPWGTTIFDVKACGWGGSPPAAGAVLLSTNPPQSIAALTLEHVYWNRLGGYNASSQGATVLYAPELLKNAWGMGWYSALHVMNVGGSAARDIQVHYYTYGGASICTDYLATPTNLLLPNRHRAIDHGGSTCVSGYDLFSAVITSDQPIVAVVNEDNALYGDFQAYNAAIAGQSRLVLPIIRKGSSPHWEDDWAASIIVQNATAAQNHVELRLYDQAGNPLPSPPNPLLCDLAPQASCLLYNEIPNNFSGSVVIVARQPVAALGSLFNNNLSDGAMKYTAVEAKGVSTLGLPGEEVP